MNGIDCDQSPQMSGDRVVRLVMSNRGTLALVLVKPRPNDIVVDREGKDSLHIDAAMGDLVDKAVLDSVDTAQGPKLSIRHDQAPPVR